jgi:hypothetical protein
MTQHTRSGFILVFALILTSLAVFLITFIASRSMLFLPYTQFMIQQQKATVLALGGIQLGLSQIAQEKKEDQTQPATQSNQSPAPAKNDSNDILMTVLPIINRWQIIKLTEKVEGIDGEIKLCITCEDGKFNINELYDFTKHEFVTSANPAIDAKKVMQEICTRIEQKMGGKNLFAGFEKFLKERQYRVNDVTELLTIKEFEIFKNAVFEEPLHKEVNKQQKSPALVLTDLFTVWSRKKTIDPWLLTNTTSRIFGLRSVDQTDEQVRKKTVQEVVKSAKNQYNWAIDWAQFMRPFYEKEYSALPAHIGSMLSTSVKPQSFSIAAHATVGQNTVRLLAIVERVATTEQGAQPRHEVTIKKIYTL